MYGLNGQAFCVLLDDAATAVTQGVQLKEDIPGLLTSLQESFSF
ncbi:hypothetical protein [Fibrella aquatica]